MNQTRHTEPTSPRKQKEESPARANRTHYTETNCSQKQKEEFLAGTNRNHYTETDGLRNADEECFGRISKKAAVQDADVIAVPKAMTFTDQEPNVIANSNALAPRSENATPTVAHEPVVSVVQKATDIVGQKPAAPVALFVYNRLDTVRKTLAHLKQNERAGETELFIFSDGGKDEKSWKQVNRLREELRRTTGFKQVTLIERPSNIYLERNILEGIASLFEKYDRLIVLEDDICTSPYFLTYMNEALEQYREDEKVMHISGFTNLYLTGKGDTYFTPHMSGWGWGTWRHKWKTFKHYATRAEALQGLTEEDCQRMQYGGSFPCLKSLDKSPIPWDICWEIAIYRHQGVCLTPTRTLVRNIGIYNGTHFRFSKWIGRYEYDRPVAGQPVQLPPLSTPVTPDPDIESLYPAAFKDWGIRYTLLGKALRFIYLKFLKK